MATLDPVRFPHGHVETAAVVGAATTMIAGVVASPSAGGAGLIVAIVFSLMVAVSAGSARAQAIRADGTMPLEPAGFDFAGLQGLGSGPLVRTIIGMVVLIAVVGFFSGITGAWWLGIGAAPLGIRLCTQYARRWRPSELQPAPDRDSSHP